MNRRGTPANLRPPWPKGTSGNPKGRPPTRSRAERLAEALDRIPGGDDRLRELAEAPDVARLVAEAWLAEILAGNFAAFKLYLDRVEGPVGAAPPPRDDTIAEALERADRRRAERGR
jgi:hypothetical protein